MGSSPRGRGKRLGGRFRVLAGGLIPARAGKTHHKNLDFFLPWAHPRAGGENKPWIETPAVGEGSSPRGRGKRRSVLRSRNGRGLIPARAGKTPACAGDAARDPAHPRAGGENHASRFVWMLSCGSSPRGRGKHGRSYYHAAIYRLIPARAGKTPGRPRAPFARRAHPRAGGENAHAGRKLRGNRGSSPRGRGKPHPRYAADNRTRLIPARAGKTKTM